MRLLCRKYHFLENSRNRILVKKFFLTKQKNTCLFIIDKEPKKNYLVQICDIECQSNMEWPLYNTDKQPSFVSCFSTREKPHMRGRGAKDIGSNSNVTLESLQCSIGEVATILISVEHSTKPYVSSLCFHVSSFAEQCHAYHITVAMFFSPCIPSKLSQSTSWHCSI